MNININNYGFKTYTRNNISSDINKNTETKPDTIKTETTKLPAFNEISFCGGKSMNLAATKKQIDKYGQYPPGVKEIIEKTLDNGNPDNKTLIDIHRENYAGLSTCSTLQEAKFLYPEFEDVKEDKEVNFADKGFVAEVKKGKVKHFNPKQDVSLQLLQLYWGECVTLPQLREYSGGKNILNTFQRLNIPRMDRNYSRYLTFSDKEFNEQYTKAVSEKSIETHKKLAEKNKGMPPVRLTEEHKAKISEGLRAYHKRKSSQ